MKTISTIPAEVAALIPFDQLQVTKRNIEAFQEAISRLETALKQCPAIGATKNAKEHPVIFHYFYGRADIYVCEYDREKGLMFGFGIANSDLQNAGWGYFRLADIINSQKTDFDFFFPEQSIETAICRRFPKYIKKLDLLTE